MDKLNAYRQAVKAALQEFTKGGYLPPQDLKEVTLFDSENDRYAVITQGWDNRDYVNELTAEIDIVDNKVYIKYNNSDTDIFGLLVSMGVAKEDIVVPYLEKV